MPYGTFSQEKLEQYSLSKRAPWVCKEPGCGFDSASHTGIMRHWLRAHGSGWGKKRRKKPGRPRKNELALIPDQSVQPTRIPDVMAREIPCRVNACPACGFAGIQLVNRAMVVAERA